MADRDRNYVGSAFVQLDRGTRERFWSTIETMKAKKAPAGIKKPDAQWVRPGSVGRVKYLRGEGGLRHASLSGLRNIRNTKPDDSIAIIASRQIVPSSKRNR